MVGNVKGKNVIIIDDLIYTARTLCGKSGVEGVWDTVSFFVCST